MVVRKSLTSMIAQIVKYGSTGDQIVVSVGSSDLKKTGWPYSCKNTPAAYLIGLLLAKKCKENGIKEAILDLGLYKSVPGSKIYAVLKGAIDNGLQVPFSDTILPKEDRVKGIHIQKYSDDIKENQDERNKRFGGYIKNNADPSNISSVFEQIKSKITGA